MGMSTKIKKMGDTCIVSMEGNLDFETQGPLKSDLEKLVKRVNTDSVPKKIIFDFVDLEFVGSSGITSFVQALKEFNQSVPMRPRYCNVKSEFKSVIRAFDDESPFEFHEDQEGARRSFDQ